MDHYKVRHSPSSNPAVLVCGDPHVLRGTKSFAKETDIDARAVVAFIQKNLCGETAFKIRYMLNQWYSSKGGPL